MVAVWVGSCERHMAKFLLSVVEKTNFLFSVRRTIYYHTPENCQVILPMKIKPIFMGIFGAFMYNAATMVITHQGGQCFKVTFGDTTIAFDPISKKSSQTAVKFGANIAFVSMNHPDFNGIPEVTYGNKAPFVVDGPGEYEIGEVTARGFGVPTTYEKEKKYSTIYQVNLEGMNLVFLGAIGEEALSDPKVIGELGDIDVLFIPVGGGDVMDAPAASKVATKLEAKIIIPMHYDKKALDAFLKEEGSQNGAPQEKLTLKKKDLIGKEGEIVVLKA